MSIDKIVCVGKNYRDHILEMGEPAPLDPVLFLKPPSVLKQAAVWGETLKLYFPANDSDVQPECELVIQVAQDGFQMTAAEAELGIAAVTIGLDMTRRTHQTALKKAGHPWTAAKVFMDSAVIGPWIPRAACEAYLETPFQLTIDGFIRQEGVGRDMMMLPNALLMYISQFFPLKTGDIIFTGTPAGVTSVRPNSHATLQWGHYAYSVEWG